MKDVNAFYIPEKIVFGSELPGSSYSEYEECFVLGAKWAYTLPNGCEFFETKPTLGEFTEVVGEHPEKGLVTIGYFCPVVFIMFGTVYKTQEECEDEPFFHPNYVDTCREQDIPNVVAKQKRSMEDGEYE